VHCNSATHLVVISGRVFQLVALRLLVIDPQLRVIKRNQVGHALHGQLRLNFLLGGHGGEVGNAAVVPILLQVDGVAATVGITDYAQESLGDIVFVELPKVGAELAAGKTFGSVESVKAVSDLYAPASGTVTAVNPDLATSPEKVNKDAHGSWMLKLTLKTPGELSGLLSAEDYEKFVKEEAGH